MAGNRINSGGSSVWSVVVVAASLTGLVSGAAVIVSAVVIWRCRTVATAREQSPTLVETEEVGLSFKLQSTALSHSPARRTEPLLERGRRLENSGRRASRSSEKNGGKHDSELELLKKAFSQNSEQLLQKNAIEQGRLVKRKHKQEKQKEMTHGQDCSA
jgi:hypothetical protein